MIVPLGYIDHESTRGARTRPDDCGSSIGDGALGTQHVERSVRHPSDMSTRHRRAHRKITLCIHTSKRTAGPSIPIADLVETRQCPSTRPRPAMRIPSSRFSSAFKPGDKATASRSRVEGWSTHLWELLTGQSIGLAKWGLTCKNVVEMTTLWALRDSNPRPAGCKDVQGRSSVTQFVAARRIIPGHSGCQAGVTDASATYGDVLTPNCWDASWDENASTSPPGRLASKTVSFRLMGPESMSIERCPPVVPCRVVSAIPTSARCL